MRGCESEFASNPLLRSRLLRRGLEPLNALQLRRKWLPRVIVEALRLVLGLALGAWVQQPHLIVVALGRGRISSQKDSSQKDSSQKDSTPKGFEVGLITQKDSKN